MANAARLFMLLALVSACGDDGGSVTADAAPDGAVDAAADGAVDAASPAYLGRFCPENTCPTPGQCLLPQENQPGYCSLVCGESAVLGIRPTEADPMCEAIYDKTEGTPICGMIVDFAPGAVTWACVIDCAADGLCPPGLTCQLFDDLAQSSMFCLR